MNVTGTGIDRVDGRLKVRGEAPFAAEFEAPGMAHAVLVTSRVPSGRVERVDAAAALAAPGVLAVLTPFDAPRLPGGGREAMKPPAGRVLSLLQDDAVAYAGQPVAVVVADTLERAAEGARLVRVHCAQRAAALDFDAARPGAYAPAKANREETDHRRGDLAAGLAAAAHRVEATYATPIEHHNPMEPHATLARWDGDRLTVHDATQYVAGDRDTLARLFGIAPENVTVIDPFVGGGFGCKGSTWSHVALAAMAARHVGRPVRLVLERPQMFGPVGNRPRTEQRLVLGAAADGMLTALGHASISETSTLEDWVEPSALPSRMLYACANVESTHRLVKLDIPTPTYTRAPGEASGNFALECALDELAHAAGVDPLQMRLRNHADSDGGKGGRPFSSKSLRACYAQGAERFGWPRRAAAPGSLRDGRWQVGHGMATATYPANRSAAEASVRISADGTALVRSATHELGTGTYTVMTQVAADAIGLPLSRVRFECGDSRLPRAPVAGGSQSVASVAPAVQAAGLAARRRLVELAVADARSPAHGTAAERWTVVDGWLKPVDAAGLSPAARRGEPVAVLVARHGAPVEVRAGARPGAEREAYSMHGFGAVYAEVRVDADLGIVRVPRIVGVYGVGRLLNAKTAHSQLVGGIVWGVGMALLEESHRDARHGRIVNGNLADYHVPVNADIGSIDVSFVAEDDPHVNPLGAKGIGEIGITGVPAAIGNAVFQATGRRIRDLPITLDKLL